MRRSDVSSKQFESLGLYPGEDGYWAVECPSLPGCISQGKTKQEALANIKEAIEGYTAALEEDGLPVPKSVLSPWLLLYEQFAPDLRQGVCEGVRKGRFRRQADEFVKLL